MKPAEAPGVELALAARPNPSRGDLTIDFALPRAGGVSLALYDLAGRRLRTLASGDLGAGPHAVVWDGLADDGARAGTGILFLRLVTESGSIERKVLLLR